MTQDDLVRFPARLKPEVHSALVEYTKQNGGSINTAINNLLGFVLKYSLKDNGGPLDSLLPEYGSNLVKMEHIIQEFIREDTLKDFENANSQLYLDFISRKFDNMSVQDRKLLSEVAYSLAQKNEISE